MRIIVLRLTIVMQRINESGKTSEKVSTRMKGIRVEFRCQFMTELSNQTKYGEKKPLTKISIDNFRFAFCIFTFVYIYANNNKRQETVPFWISRP